MPKPETIVGQNLSTGAPVTFAQAMETQRLRGGKAALMSGEGIIPWWQAGQGMMPPPASPPPAQGLLGNRVDGTPKGYGFLGLLQRPDGDWSTELSVGVEIDGNEVEIPLLVPTLTKSEQAWLLSADLGKMDVPQEILDKAISHARKRIQGGLSPFAD